MGIGMKPKTILIRKYENRRLYDTTNSRYVNLDEVAKMMQNGDNVTVVDATSGEDITRLILTQIIVEDAKTPDSTFPLDVLRQMVIATGRASQESALAYMKAMLDISQNTLRVAAPELNPFDFIPRKNAEQSGRVAGSQPAARPGKGRASMADVPNPGEVDQLKQRLVELEAIVSRLAPKKPPRKRK
jgi:polyhydroxyalkanoate synthesis repressor PhaR